MVNKFKIIISVFLTILIPNNTCYANSIINIKGNVIDNSCVVAPGFEEQTVDLLKYSVKQLRQVGEVTLMVPFNIELLKCEQVVVKVGFLGLVDTNNNSLLAIEKSVGSASGVGIQILDKFKTPITLNATTNKIPWTTLVANKNNVLPFYARLMVTQLPVTAGNIRATATFTLEFQ